MPPASLGLARCLATLLLQLALQVLHGGHLKLRGTWPPHLLLASADRATRGSWQSLCALHLHSLLHTSRL
jgi:hypothetical protein